MSELNIPRLKALYKDKIRPEISASGKYKSIMGVPKLQKITLNMGLGKALADKKIIEAAVSDMTLISGQKPILTTARKSIAGFKIREGWTVGCAVTMRNDRMYEFLDRLISIAIPRIRDFRGLNKNSFDGRGNYSFGIHEQIVFPEIQFDKIDALRGMNITITTSAQTNDEGFLLLKMFNFPFRE